MSLLIIVTIALVGVLGWFVSRALGWRVPLDSVRAGHLSRSARGRLVTARDEYFEVGDDFFVGTSASPNGRYLVGARDGHTDERGRRRSGGCALRDVVAGTVCFNVAIARGNNPHVSNDGQVIVEDWKDQTLSGALISFNRNGEQIWARHFDANLASSGISASGSRAFVCTCNSPSPEHSGKTFLLDAATGETRFTRDGWGDVRFDGELLGVEVQGAGRSKSFFAFDDSGALPAAYHERTSRDRERRERGQYWAVLPKVQTALKGAGRDVARAKQLLAELEGKEADMPELSRARLLRFRGEIAEADGDNTGALILWKQALEIDPKVGIKRRYDALVSKSGA